MMFKIFEQIISAGSFCLALLFFLFLYLCRIVVILIKKIIELLLFIVALCLGTVIVPFIGVGWILRKIKQRSILKDAKYLSAQSVADIRDFINSHYEFKCNPKYKGLFGSIKAWSARQEYEEQDHFSPRELPVPIPDELKGFCKFNVIFRSDPPSEEELEEERTKEKEFDRRYDELMAAAREKFLMEDSFSVTLMKHIQSKGLESVEVYERANIDRRLFSKIRIDRGYMPSKRTAVTLAIALELTIDETKDLLQRAGFTLSRSLLFDVIIEYFITCGNYNIYEINEALFAYNQPLLGE